MMRRILPYIILVLGSFVSSCEFETSSNGQLDGYWQLATIENTDGQIRDMIPSRQFWSFQVRLLQISDQQFILPSYLFRFEQRGDSLLISNPYVLDRTSADQPVTDATALTPYYIYRLEQSFYIERLDAEKMCLRGDSLRFFFNRY